MSAFPRELDGASVLWIATAIPGQQGHDWTGQAVSIPPTTKKREPMMASGVIYYAGDVYGPYILQVLDGCIDPLVRKVSKDMVEVYFLAGAHTHIRQQWRLLGYTAKLEQEGEIDWKDDPRMTASAEQGGAENRR